MNKAVYEPKTYTHDRSERYKRCADEQCNAVLWENLATDKIRMKGAHNQEFEIEYTHIRAICKCGKVYEQDAQIQDYKLYQDKKIQIFEADNQGNPYRLLDKKENTRLFKDLSVEQQAIFKALVGIPGGSSKFKADNPFISGLSEELGISKDTVIGHIEKINVAIEKIRPGFSLETLKFTKIS